MSEIAISNAPSRQSIAAKDRSKPLKVTGRLRKALDLMTWEGKTDNEAAVSVGMSVVSIRLALEKAHVRAYYRAQREVLLERESPRNIHRLAVIRDKADNMPAVNSAIALEKMRVGETAARSTGSLSLPGLTIQIITAAPTQPVNEPLTRHVSQVIDNTDESTS